MDTTGRLISDKQSEISKKEDSESINRGIKRLTKTHVVSMVIDVIGVLV